MKFAPLPQVRSNAAQQGLELQTSPTPQEFLSLIKMEFARAAKIVREAGVTPE